MTQPEILIDINKASLCLGIEEVTLDTNLSEIDSDKVYRMLLNLADIDRDYYVYEVLEEAYEFGSVETVKELVQYIQL